MPHRPKVGCSYIGGLGSGKVNVTLDGIPGMVVMSTLLISVRNVIRGFKLLTVLELHRHLHLHFAKLRVMLHLGSQLNCPTNRNSAL